MDKWHKKRRIGMIILAVALVFLLAGLAGLGMKVRHDLNTPFQYHLQARMLQEGENEVAPAATSDG